MSGWQIITTAMFYAAGAAATFAEARRNRLGAADVPAEVLVSALWPVTVLAAAAYRARCRIGHRRLR